MKIRTGFVSNSSSSSFIVIKRDELHYPKYDDIVVDCNFGECEFGWDFNRYFDFESKLIFCILQALFYTKDKRKSARRMAMIRNVVLAATGAKTLEIRLNPENYDAYIDHQSNATEGRNEEMFRSERDLKHFLFSKNSCIVTGNDNSESGWSLYEAENKLCK